MSRLSLFASRIFFPQNLCKYTSRQTLDSFNSSSFCFSSLISKKEQTNLYEFIP